MYLLTLLIASLIVGNNNPALASPAIRVERSSVNTSVPDKVPPDSIGDDAESLKQYIREAVEANDLESLIENLDLLADLYDDEQQYPEGEICILTAINALKELTDRRDPQLGCEYFRLAGHYVRSGDLQYASKANLSAVHLFRSMSRANPLAYAIALRNQGWLDYCANNYASARRNYSQCLSLLQNRMAHIPLLIGLVANDLGELQAERQSFKDAEKYLALAARTLGTELGDDDKIVHHVLKNYATVLRENHKATEARGIEFRISHKQGDSI